MIHVNLEGVDTLRLDHRNHFGDYSPQWNICIVVSNISSGTSRDRKSTCLQSSMRLTFPRLQAYACLHLALDARGKIEASEMGICLYCLFSFMSLSVRYLHRHKDSGNEGIQ